MTTSAQAPAASPAREFAEPAPTPAALLLLGRGRDLASERGSSARATCPRRPTRGWSSGPARRRRRWATACSCWVTTTSATRSSSSPT
nr:hypothetical protein [Angustibacter aerolatus]